MRAVVGNPVSLNLENFQQITKSAKMSREGKLGTTVFFPNKEFIKRAKSCLVCGAKDDVMAGDIVEFLQAKGFNAK